MEFTSPITAESLYYLQRRGDCLATASRAQPRTVQEILDAASQSMDVEDLVNAYLHGQPLPAKMKRPRKRLRELLYGHR
jgi:hypothetical protein